MPTRIELMGDTKLVVTEDPEEVTKGLKEGWPSLTRTNGKAIVVNADQVLHLQEAQARSGGRTSAGGGGR